jgi:hypothetical protein
MTCKDCISYEACKFNNKNLPEEYDPIEWQCDNFKDKSLVVELPYPLRTKVFVIRSQTSDKNNLYIFEDYITGYIYGKYGLLMTFDYHLSEDNFERVFTDKSKAEEKLKELNNETT